MNELSAFSPVDIVALLMVAAGGIQGYFRGLSGEIARLVGTVLAFFTGIWLRQPVGLWITEHTRLQDRAADATAFITTVFLALLIMVVLRMIVKKVVKVVFAESVDKLAGVFAGMLRMTLFVLIIFLCMNMVPHEYLNRVFGEDSTIGSVVVKYVPMVKSRLEESNIIKTESETEAGGPSAEEDHDNESGK